MTTAWLFPGQGAQKVGMGQDVFEASAAARAVYEQADEALGQKISTLCFEGPIEELTRTANTQPALVTTSMALLAAARERFGQLVEPACAAGHSLGEYSALCAAGALWVTDAVLVARARGEAMQAAVAEGVGAMAAIMGQEDEALQELCAQVGRELEQVVSPANFNAPGQIVIAGHAEAVGRVVALVKEQRGKAIPLKVSAPFHCSLMQPAVAQLQQALMATDLNDAHFDVLANVDAAPHRAAAEVSEALLQQVDHPVRWVDTILAVRARGITQAFEFGPGKVLAGLCRRIDKQLSVLSVNSLASLDKLGEVLEK